MLQILIAALIVPTLAQAVMDDGLPNLRRSSSFYDQQHAVICMAQAFTAAESKKVFGVDLIKKHIRPILLVLENRSTSSFTLLASDVDLDCIPAKRIADELQYNTAAFATATGIPALLYCWQLCLPIGAMAYEFYRHNHWVDELITQNSLAAITTLGPLQTVKKLIFVPDDAEFNQFSVRLHSNNRADELTFNVDLLLTLKRMSLNRAHSELIEESKRVGD